MGVDELLNTHTSRQLAEWEAMYRLDPFGEERADMRAALVCKVIAERTPGNKKRFKIRDFLLRFAPRRAQSTEEMKLVWHDLMEALSSRGNHR